MKLLNKIIEASGNPEHGFTVQLVRPAYVDTLAKAAANLSRHREHAATAATHAGESYEKALARAAVRVVSK